MPKYTLLDIVQKVLSEKGGDLVNSIDDTIEAGGVAEVAETVFYELCTLYNVRSIHTTFSLAASGSSLLPTIMTRPAGIKGISLVKYDSRKEVADPPAWRDIRYISPQDFLDLTLARNLDAPDVISQTLPSGEVVLVFNNRAPTYWTSFNDTTIVFDSFDSAIESTLQESKSLAYGEAYPTFSISDVYTIQLPENLQPLYLLEVLVRAVPDSPAHVQKQLIKMRAQARHIKDITPRIALRPNFGKRRNASTGEIKL